GELVDDAADRHQDDLLVLVEVEGRDDLADSRLAHLTHGPAAADPVDCLLHLALRRTDADAARGSLLTACLGDIAQPGSVLEVNGEPAVLVLRERADRVHLVDDLSRLPEHRANLLLSHADFDAGDAAPDDDLRV